LNLLNTLSTMNLKQPIYFVLSVLLAVGISACNSKKDDKTDDSDEFDESETLKNQIEELVYKIPRPTEIPYLLQATGAEFNETLVNDNSKVDKYTTRSEKAALNLGVYVADIGYLSSYDKTQEAINYLAACKSLADNLGLIGTFDADIVKEFEAKITNKDSLARLLDRTIHQTKAFLNDDNRNKLSSLVVTGSFVEGLYISTGLVKSYPKDILPEDSRNLILTPIMSVILKQKDAVSELIRMLKSVEQAEPVTSIIADLEQLEKAYQDLNIDEQIRKNRADLALTDKNLVGITEIVERLRNRITE
jgi:hypothetical protein